MYFTLLPFSTSCLTCMLFVLILVNVSFFLYLILLHSSSFHSNIHAVIICALPRFIDSPSLCSEAMLILCITELVFSLPHLPPFAVASSLYV